MVYTPILLDETNYHVDMPRSAAQPKVVFVAPAPRKRAPKKSSGAMVAVGRLRGHGDYSYDRPGPWGRIGSAAGGMIGSAMGSPYGLGKAAGAIGKKLGSYAHYIGKFFGSGDYVTSADQVRSNVLMNEAQAPQFGHGKNTVHIRHREFLMDVVSSGTASAFQLQSIPIQPGLLSSFPWLSQICGSSFQQYRINGMVFEFRSMSADALNSTNTALGSVVMATDYDSKDANFASKQQMENTEFGVSCKPASCMIHGIECARSQTSISELYVRNAAVPSGTDQRLYDMGNFQIATVGVQGTSVNLGELWVSYDITLFKAVQLLPGANQQVTHVNLAGTDSTKPLLIDTSVNAIQPVFDSLGVTLVSNSVVSLPPRLALNTEIIVLFAVRGASTASLVPPAIVGSNGLIGTAGWPAFINGTSSGYTGPQTVNTSTTIFTCNSFKYDGTGTLAARPSLTFGTTGTFPGAPVQGGDLYIIVMNGNLS